MKDAELMQRVDDAIGELERLPEVRARELAREAMRAVLELHREALARVLGALRERGALGQALTQHLAKDPLVSSVLALHDLHPEDLSQRIHGALESVRPLLSLNGVALALAGVETGDVQVTLTRAAGCPSTATRMRGAVEEALDKAAPDARSIRVLEERE